MLVCHLRCITENKILNVHGWVGEAKKDGSPPSLAVLQTFISVKENPNRKEKKEKIYNGVLTFYSSTYSLLHVTVKSISLTQVWIVLSKKCHHLY